MSEMDWYVPDINKILINVGALYTETKYHPNNNGSSVDGIFSI